MMQNHSLVTPELLHLLDTKIPNKNYYPLKDVEFKVLSDNGLVCYDPDVSYYLYVCFLLNYRSVTISIDDIEYVIDFNEFLQINKLTNFKRIIIYGPKQGYSDDLPSNELWYLFEKVNIDGTMKTTYVKLDKETNWQLVHWPTTRDIKSITPIGYINRYRKYFIILKESKLEAFLVNTDKNEMSLIQRRDYTVNHDTFYPVSVVCARNTYQARTGLEFVEEVKADNIPSIMIENEDMLYRPKEILQRFNIKFESNLDLEDRQCYICLDTLKSSDIYHDNIPRTALRLEKCYKHYFHDVCIVGCIQNGNIKCPICEFIYGLPSTGTQPNGIMRVFRIVNKLPSFDCPTLTMFFSFKDGTQQEHHIEPGMSYKGYNYRSYLPDNEEGHAMLELFKVAWKRRLLFTIGHADDTGARVIRSGAITLKTAPTGVYGYPDQDYPTRLREEMARIGVVV